MRASISKASNESQNLAQPDILCGKCSSIFEEDSQCVSSIFRMKYYTMSELVMSAEGNCHFCLLVLNHIPAETAARLRAPRELVLGDHEAELVLDVRRQILDEIGYSTQVKYYVSISIVPEDSKIREVTENSPEGNGFHKMLPAFTLGLLADLITEESLGASVDSINNWGSENHSKNEVCTVVLQPLEDQG